MVARQSCRTTQIHGSKKFGVSGVELHVRAKRVTMIATSPTAPENTEITEITGAQYGRNPKNAIARRDRAIARTSAQMATECVAKVSGGFPCRVLEALCDAVPYRASSVVSKQRFGQKPYLNDFHEFPTSCEAWLHTFDIDPIFLMRPIQEK